ncbi:hypothetical protein, partial [Pseudomonas sp. PS01303]|uniref:hypothetical protein n=1 Tax=Pseudomonas sp. PS01303 TaxID=2991439 RepID=UPI00249C6EEC
IAECQSANELPDTPPSRAGSLLHLLCGDLLEIRHYSDVKLHTMTIRRLLVLSGLRSGLFFYSQLKDIDSITGSSQSSRGG